MYLACHISAQNQKTCTIYFHKETEADFMKIRLSSSSHYCKACRCFTLELVCNYSKGLIFLDDSR